MNFSMIVAMDENRGIGFENGIPWKLPTDMKNFKTVTTTTRAPKKMNAVIMGRKTWESIPKKFRPLPDRLSIILSRNIQQDSLLGMLVADSLENALKLAEAHGVEEVFVIGGEQIYKEAIKSPDCQVLYVTEICSKFNCDAHFPDFKEQFKLVDHGETITENGVPFVFCQYTR